jgi:epoxyqueuosine reductase
MAPVPTAPELADIGLAAGLDVVRVAGAEFFAQAYEAITQRKEQGLHGGMWFTYGRPERSCDPQRALPGAQAVVVAARLYQQQTPRALDGQAQGRVARVQWDEHYAELEAGLEHIKSALTAAGFNARVLVDSNLMVDRAAAVRAGIGWFGKNTNVLIPDQGSWFVLGTVVTDAPIAPDEHVEDGCGTCVACIEACPTAAIVAPGVLDARRCLAWLLQDDGNFPIEYRSALEDRIYGCDDCQEVCPVNRLADRRRPTPVSIRPTRAWVNIARLLRLGDEELMDEFGDWYIPRRQPDYLRRNALVVLGNIADPEAPEVATTLTRYLEHENTMLVAHAIWAARRLGLDHLLGSFDQTSEPTLIAELQANVEQRRLPA